MSAATLKPLLVCPHHCPFFGKMIEQETLFQRLYFWHLVRTQMVAVKQLLRFNIIVGFLNI